MDASISLTQGTFAPLVAALPEVCMDSIDLKQIRCFVAAYEEHTFSKAAKREHCTQPGLSVYIQRLESILSHRLFERNSAGVTPTVAGKHFYASCTEVLEAVREARQRMVDMAGGLAGSINIGMAPSIQSAVTAMLPGYMADHPFVDVRIAEAYSGALIDWVAAGEVDVAIVNRPPAHLGLRVTDFFRDRLVLVRRPSSTDKKKGKRRRTIEARKLQRLRLVLPSRRHALRQVVENVLRPGVTSEGKILELDGMLGTLELIRNSDWATIVPRIALIDEVKQGRLVAELISEPDLWIDFFVVQTKDSLLSVACSDFLARVRGKLQEISRSYPDA